MSRDDPRDIAELRERRRRARRRRRIARLDVALGAVCALVVIFATPGLAIAGIVALAVLLVCLLAALLEHGASRRASRRAVRERDADGRSHHRPLPGP